MTGATLLRDTPDAGEVDVAQERDADAGVSSGPRAGFTHVPGAPGVSACAVLTAG